MARPQPRDVPASVRAWREVLSRAVQPEHLVDEGYADAEEFCHFRDGAVAAQGGREHPLPQVE